MLKVYRYIEERYFDAELGQLAKLLNYDISWLSRSIKRTSGRTFKEILLSKRLSQALYLLQNTELSVETIGHKIGYTNLSYFYRIFKDKYKITPNQLRQKRTL